MEKSDLQAFYAGQSIFITGGTGFLGKVLLEKLLRCCPDISCIYLLLRPKKGKTVTDRVRELVDDPALDNLKEKKTQIEEKIIGISGDCSLPNLGISTEDRNLLINNVTIVIHAAATIRFTEKLNIAARINLEATATILDLCKNMQNLKSFIHVSTTYSNCFTSKVEEKFYDYSINYNQFLNIVNSLPEDILHKITPELISPWPNTYTFTKAMTENMIQTESEGLPMGIFRPGIVLASVNEPQPGWIDQPSGLTGVIAGASYGILRTTFCDEKAIANLVPVDYVVNALIATVRNVAVQSNRRGKEMLIYNYSSTVEAPITYGKIVDSSLKYMNECRMRFTFRYFFYPSKHKWVFRFYTVFLHWIPAVFIDTILYCTSGKPRLRNMYTKIHKLIEIVAYFSTNEWDFENKNTRNLWSHLDPADKKLFPFSMQGFDWDTYIYNYNKGIRTYILKGMAKPTQISTFNVLLFSFILLFTLKILGTRYSGSFKEHLRTKIITKIKEIKN